MNCENLQFNLSLYIDDVLSNDERVSIERHLPTCPLCRQKLSEYKELKNDLRMISRPVIPAELLSQVRSAVANQINQPTIQVVTEVQQSLREKFTHWLMPYSVGTIAASIFAFVLFSFILTGTNEPGAFLAADEKPSESSILLAKSTPDKIRDDLSLPPEYQQIAITNFHPEVNPDGALVELTKSIVRGKIYDEELVIVADVFNNGLAQINEIVEPSNDDKVMNDLQKAFQTNPEDAPFLPTKNRKTSESVRVILKIQRVDIK